MFGDVHKDRAKKRTEGEWLVYRSLPVIYIVLMSNSVRAWRGLRFNEKYAAKLEKKSAKKRAQEKAKAEVEAVKNKIATMSNPFSVRKCSISWTINYSYFH
jgi:hypothetical protein